jgi:hypothetical protein
MVNATAKWEGGSLVIETTREIRGTTITTKEVRALDTGCRVPAAGTPAPDDALAREPGAMGLL